MSGSRQIRQMAARNLSRAMIYAARWIMAPIYLGLLVSLLLLAEKSIQKLVEAVPDLLVMSSSDMILTVLTMVDLSLVGNLVVIVMVSGWENFVGRLLTRRDEGSSTGWASSTSPQ